ncbi:hypothetical protein BVC80_1633g16 [Macleaya cordata]|uniref:Uncharacterized protein n=1 Tax=Macleaya cordata TaxID=56857 RepID=A0A200PPU3_MACCD|nr:hypothetical protein BVC80_1633g16 [Macleaya cordata]
MKPQLDDPSLQIRLKTRYPRLSRVLSRVLSLHLVLPVSLWFSISGTNFFTVNLLRSASLFGLSKLSTPTTNQQDSVMVLWAEHSNLFLGDVTHLVNFCSYRGSGCESVMQDLILVDSGQ